MARMALKIAVTHHSISRTPNVSEGLTELLYSPSLTFGVLKVVAFGFLYFSLSILKDSVDLRPQ